MVSATIAVTRRTGGDAHPAFADEGRPAYAMTAAVTVATLLLLPLWGFSLRGLDYQILGVTGALLLPFAWCLRARGFSRIATLVETWTLLAAFCTIVSLLLFILAAANMPLVDDQLAAVDRWLLPQVDWLTMMQALARRSYLIAPATICYASLLWQPSVLLVACALTGHEERCWTFINVWMLVLVVTTVLFVLFPAVGPYPHFHVPRAAMPAMTDPTPWITPGLVASLRDGTLRAIALSDRAGIVTFPSFHAGAAVLLAWSFRPLRWIGKPMVAVNAGMLAATIPVGGHYFIDVLAGVALVTAVLVAVRYAGRPNTRAKIVSTCL